MKITSVLACLAAAAILASATALPARADTSPQRLTACGQTITAASAYLDRDLTCAQGFVTPRSTTDSSHLTVDLRGHRLRGTGSGMDSNVRHFTDGSYTVVVLANADPPMSVRLTDGLARFLAAQPK